MLEKTNGRTISSESAFLLFPNNFKREKEREKKVSLSYPTAQLRGYLNPRAGDLPVNISECFLRGPRASGWLCFGLLCRLWPWFFRVRGGFVVPC